MTRKGQITVTGTQWDEAGEEQTTRTTATAEYRTVGEGFYILYEENTAEVGEITKNMIKLKGSTLELTRKGAVSTRMVFEPGQEHRTLYSTPFGSLPLGILTDTVESVLSENQLLISVAYSLTCQGLTSQGPPQQSNIISRCRIIIKMLLEG